MPDLRAGADVVGRRHRLVQVFGRRSGPGRSLDAYLGLHAPGGDRVGQCRVVAFVLVGVGLAEVGHDLVSHACPGGPSRSTFALVRIG